MTAVVAAIALVLVSAAWKIWLALLFSDDRWKTGWPRFRLELQSLASSVVLASGLFVLLRSALT